MILISAFSYNSGTIFDYTFAPSISAICVYYWFFTNYNIIGKISVFIIGLFSDIVLLNPLGVEAIALLLACYITEPYREKVLKYGFKIVWGYFAYFFFIVFSIKILLTSLFFFTININTTLISQFLFTFLLYPIIHKLLSYIKLTKIVSFRI